MNENPASAFYLYGLTRPDLVLKVSAASPSDTADVPPDPAGAVVPDGCGIDGEHPPFCWCHGESAAILSLVSRDEFCGPAADANLQDLAWVGTRVWRHQAVLEQTMHFAPVLPARFGTLFSSLEILGQFMERHRAGIAHFLEGIAGLEEWAVKGLFDRGLAEEEFVRQQLAEGKARTAAAPGLAYLHEERARLKAKAGLEDWLAGACGSVLEQLAPLASEGCQRQVLSRETTGANQEMVLNWAFLVPRRALAEFRKRIEHVNARQTLPGLTFALSGPWPPYSFCPALDS